VAFPSAQHVVCGESFDFCLSEAFQVLNTLFAVSRLIFVCLSLFKCSTCCLSSSEVSLAVHLTSACTYIEQARCVHMHAPAHAGLNAVSTSCSCSYSFSYIHSVVHFCLQVYSNQLFLPFSCSLAHIYTPTCIRTCIIAYIHTDTFMRTYRRPCSGMHRKLPREPQTGRIGSQMA
jgi:hypothetical protein